MPGRPAEDDSVWPAEVGRGLVAEAGRGEFEKRGEEAALLPALPGKPASWNWFRAEEVPPGEGLGSIGTIERDDEDRLLEFEAELEELERLDFFETTRPDVGSMRWLWFISTLELSCVVVEEEDEEVKVPLTLRFVDELVRDFDSVDGNVVADPLV